MAAGEPRGGQTSTNQGSGIPIREFAADAKALSLPDFEDKHGSGFLLVTAAQQPQRAGLDTTEIELLGIDDHAGNEVHGERTADLTLVVHSIRRRQHSPGHLVTVGRAANNDVVIPDLSVSRFHAFLKPLGDGRFEIQSANISTNGTTLNGTSVAAQGSGPGADLKSGDSVRFGQVETTFLSAAALRDFALLQGGRRATSPS